MRRLGVEPGVPALVDGNRRQLLLGRAVQVHVAPKGKGKRPGGIEAAVGGVLFEQGAAKAVAVGFLVCAVDQQDVVGHAGVEQQGGVLDHVTAGCPGCLDRTADPGIQAEHQPDLEIVALAAVTGLDEQTVDIVLVEPAVLKGGPGRVNGQLVAGFVRHRALRGVADADNTHPVP